MCDLYVAPTNGRELYHDHSFLTLPSRGRKLAGKLDTSILVQEVAKLENLFRSAKADALHFEACFGE